MLKRSDGLMPAQKMACQIVVTAIFAFYLVKFTDVSLAMKIPFFPGHEIDFGILTIPILFVAVIGAVNGVNFTDGLDGLASSVTIMVATFFSVVAIGTKSGIEPITCAVVGALMGFYCSMSIRQRFSWEIPVLWRWEALWQVRLICFRCRYSS